MAWKYCDVCQLPRTECAEDCPGHMEREYEKAMNEWASGPDFMETSPS